MFVRWSVLSLLLIILTMGVLPAQTSGQPNVDDKALYVIGLRLVGDLAAQSATLPTASDRKAFLDAVRADLGVTQAEFQMLVRHSSTFDSQPNPLVQQTTLQDRDALITKTIASLSQELSPAGFTSFRRFLNERLRPNTTMTTFNNK